MLVELSLPTKCDPSLKMRCPQSVAWVNRQGVSVWTSLLCPEPSDEPCRWCEWAFLTPRGALTLQTLAHCGYKQSKTHCFFPCQRPCALFFPSWRVFLHVRSVFSSASSQSLQHISAVDLCTSKKSRVYFFLPLHGCSWNASVLSFPSLLHRPISILSLSAWIKSGEYW